MTVETSTSKAQALGNGAQTAFPFAFRIFADTDLVVTRTVIATGVDTELVLNTDYTVAGAGDYDGGTVTTTVAPAVGTRLTVQRVLDVIQQTDLKNQGSFSAEVHEDVFDRLTMVQQQQQETLDRTLSYPASDPALGAELPSAAARANKVLAFDADGNPVANTADAAIAQQAAADAAAQAEVAAEQAALAIAAKNAAEAAIVGLEPSIAAGTTGQYWRGDKTWQDFAGAVRAAGAYAIETKARLSLTAGVAVTESDVATATSVYVIPAGHNMTLLYDGTNDVPRSYAALTIALDATNVIAGRNYDVFLAYSGGNVVAGYGPDWTAGAVAGSATARGTGAGSTEIESFNGRFVNKNAITLRNSSGTTYAIAARQATLIGGFRATANGMTEDSTAKRFVWSVQAEPRPLNRADLTDSWAYSVATLRQANNNTANQVEWFHGLGGRKTSIIVVAIVTNSTATARGVYIGIGIDSVTVDSATIRQFKQVSSAAIDSLTSTYEGYVGIGYHKAVWLEAGNGTDVQTWYGDAGGTILRSGMAGATLQ